MNHGTHGAISLSNFIYSLITCKLYMKYMIINQNYGIKHSIPMHVIIFFFSVYLSFYEN